MGWIKSFSKPVPPLTIPLDLVRDLNYTPSADTTQRTASGDFLKYWVSDKTGKVPSGAKVSWSRYGLFWLTVDISLDGNTWNRLVNTTSQWATEESKNGTVAIPAEYIDKRVYFRIGAGYPYANSTVGPIYCLNYNNGYGTGKWNYIRLIQ